MTLQHNWSVPRSLVLLDIIRVVQHSQHSSDPDMDTFVWLRLAMKYLKILPGTLHATWYSEWATIQMISVLVPWWFDTINAWGRAAEQTDELHSLKNAPLWLVYLINWWLSENLHLWSKYYKNHMLDTVCCAQW